MQTSFFTIAARAALMDIRSATALTSIATAAPGMAMIVALEASNALRAS
jgi:hypothetical protein